MFASILTRRLCSDATMAAFSLETITSLETRTRTFDIINKLPKFPLPTKDKKAAVLLPLVVEPEGLSILYTLRSANLKSHPSHVAFPGGKVDPTDKDYVDTALRETEEELGIPRSAIEIWGQFPNPMPSKNYEMSVYPIVGFIRNYTELKLNPNPDEVQEVFTVPLRVLADRQYFGFQQFKNGYTVPIFMGGAHKIWGLTSIITHIFLSALLPESEYPMQFQHISGPSIQPKL